MDQSNINIKEGGGNRGKEEERRDKQTENADDIV